MTRLTPMPDDEYRRACRWDLVRDLVILVPAVGGAAVYLLWRIGRDIFSLW